MTSIQLQYMILNKGESEKLLSKNLDIQLLYPRRVNGLYLETINCKHVFSSRKPHLHSKYVIGFTPRFELQDSIVITTCLAQKKQFFATRNSSFILRTLHPRGLGFNGRTSPATSFGDLIPSLLHVTNTP